MTYTRQTPKLYNPKGKSPYVVYGWTQPNDIGETVTWYQVVKNGVTVKTWTKPGSHLSDKEMAEFLGDFKRLME